MYIIRHLANQNSLIDIATYAISDDNCMAYGPIIAGMNSATMSQGVEESQALPTPGYPQVGVGFGTMYIVPSPILNSSKNHHKEKRFWGPEPIAGSAGWLPSASGVTTYTPLVPKNYHKQKGV